MKATDYIAEFLYRRGVRTVFELSGGMITHMLDSLHAAGKVRIVSVHHEQAAAFAADASGRITGVPGVAMATSGPGATNLLTGIASCHFDSSPAVFITGQVNRHELKAQRGVRQLGFQETDIVAMASPVTKAAWQVQEAADLPEILGGAFELAVAGRPGPVLVDIPMDIQRAQVEPSWPITGTPPPVSAGINSGEEWMSALVAALGAARRPLVLAGAGVRAGHAAAEFTRFVEAAGLPVVHSLMAVDLLAFHHPLRVGMIGSYGNRWANMAIAESDFLLVIGSRLDVRQTGADTGFFAQGRVIFHVDCETAEINNRILGCHAVVAEVGAFLAGANAALPGTGLPDWRPWRHSIDRLRALHADTAELGQIPGIHPNVFMHRLSSWSGGAAGYISDVGQHQMWAAQSLELAEGQRFITSGGMGAMGFALPAAVGAAFAVPGRPWVVVAGDGGFQCNIQELQTVVRNHLPLKIVVINNRCHGMVRQFQESYFGARYQSTLWGYSAPDFVKVAAAYGVEAQCVSEAAGCDEALASLWSDPSRPALLEVMVDTYLNSYPKIAFGRPINAMEPDATPVAMEST